MKRFAAAVAVGAVTASWLLLTAGPAFACTCVEPPPPLEARDRADAVFRGRVMSAVHVRGVPEREDQETGDVLEVDAVAVTFDVREVWAGPVVRRTTIYTSAQSSACGFDFVSGEEYVVYASEEHDGLWTSICTRTRHVDHAGEDIAALRAAADPRDVTDRLVWFVRQRPVIAAVLAAGILAGVWAALTRPDRARGHNP